jgi:hypothetical protein
LFWKGFSVILREFSEMWNSYVKNIMFACSLPISTSTWHSNHHNGPSRYMSGELESENINIKKALLNKAIIQQRSLNYPIEYNYILERYYSKNPKYDSSTSYKDPQDQKTLMDCRSLLNIITDNLYCSLR